MRLKAIIASYFGLEIEGEPLTIDPESQEIKDILEDLLKYERFPSEEFSAENISQRNQQLLTKAPQASPTHELFVDKDMNPPLQKDFKLFLPATHVENERVPEKASYGTHFYYFVIRYIYTIYLKLLLASNLSNEETSLQGLPVSAFNIYLQLTASYALDKIETMRYDLAILNLFGQKGKYLLNLKFLLYQTSKAVQSLNDDRLSNEFFDKALGKINENESEEELFSFTCDYINSADEEIKNTENFVYRFHFNPSRGWFSTSVFDVKGVFMRALKTQEKIPLTSDKPTNISPKMITVKRNNPPQTAPEVIRVSTSVTETTVESSGELLGKRKERITVEEVGSVTEGGEPEVEKRIHQENS